MVTVAIALKRKGIAPITVPPDTTVLDALRMMADKNIGSLVVQKDNIYLGIVTERDYSRKVVLFGKSSDDTKVEEIMTRDLPHLSLQDTMESCMQLMTQLNVRYLPVIESDKLAGIISMSDVVKETILSQKDTIDQLQHYIQS